MALDILYWPVQLPNLALKDGFIHSIEDSTLRTSPDMGPSLQRSKHDPMLDTLSFSYRMTRKNLDIFKQFQAIAGARSFYTPFPDPNDTKYHKSKWWYARLKSAGQESVADPIVEFSESFIVPLILEFWIGVPGVEIPEGGEGIRRA